MPRGRKARVGRGARDGLGEKSIDNLVGCAVAAYGDEVAAPLGVGITGDLSFVTRAAGFSDFYGDAAARRRSSAGATILRQRPPPAAGFTTARNVSLTVQPPQWHGQRCLPISSARRFRLIFIDAVRGKSSFQIRYPPMRLKSGSFRFRAIISALRRASNS